MADKDDLLSAQTAWFKDYFDKEAEDGVLGDPDGILSYAYLRCSSSGQVEEGRSGLPRQLQHIAEVAKAKHLKITWGTTYFDDHTGFEFESRPALSLLRRETKKSKRACNVVVIEYLDRLSRNARWHQGYLLDEFERQGVRVLFWKAFGSEIERAVMGAISEQGMREEIARMVEGTLYKARDQRVTAKVRKYGFIFVDGEGKEGEKARKDTHYALHPEESKTMVLVYDKIVSEGWSLYQVCDYLERSGVPTRRGAKHWHTGTLSKLVRDPIYKGEFYANRFYRSKSANPETGQVTLNQRRKPVEEWIAVPVPPVVSPATWQMAQDAITKKRKTAERNLKKERLLSGYLVCARCGRAFHGAGGTKEHPSMYYYCGSWIGLPSVREKEYCGSSTVFCGPLDEHVWQSLVALVLDPTIVTQALDDEVTEEKRQEYEEQNEYLSGKIKSKEMELSRWDQAYGAGYLTVDEWGEKHKAILVEIASGREGLRQVEDRLTDVRELETKKELAIAFLTELQRRGVRLDMPFAEKRKVLSLLVDRIVINAVEKWYRIEGVIRGTFTYQPGEGGGGEGQRPNRSGQTGTIVLTSKDRNMSSERWR